MKKQPIPLKKQYRFYDEFLRCDFFFFYGWNEDEYKAYAYRKFGMNPPEGKSRGMCSFSVDANGYPSFLIWITHEGDPANIITALSHEMLHAAQGIFKHRGAEYDPELLAYYQEMLNHKFIKKMGVIK